MAGASWFLNREAIRQRFLSPRESNRKNKNLAHKTRGIEWCLGYPPMVYRPTSGSSSKETKNMTPEVAFAHLQLHSILFFFNIGSRLFHFVSSTSLQMPGCGIYWRQFLTYCCFFWNNLFFFHLRSEGIHVSYDFGGHFLIYLPAIFAQLCQTVLKGHWGNGAICVPSYLYVMSCYYEFWLRWISGFQKGSALGQMVFWLGTGSSCSACFTVRAGNVW